MFAPEQLHDMEHGADHAEGQPLVLSSMSLGDLHGHDLPPHAPQLETLNGKAAKANAAKKNKKATAAVNVRNWLRIDQNGETSMMSADKYKLTHKLGVQGRDLRIMDPSLATGYPAAILCRDKALVVSLEHIKVIITTTNVLVMNPEDENVLPFITELKMKLTQPTLAVSGSYPSALNELASKAAVSTSKSAAKFENLAALQMPFELKALEVCLDSVSGLLALAAAVAVELATAVSSSEPLPQ
jgi:magnesium transporter